MSDKESSGKLKRFLAVNRIIRLWLSPHWDKKTGLNKDTERYATVVLWVCFSLLAALILFPRPQQSYRLYRLGDVSETDIKASTDFLIEDQESTEKRRQEIREDIPSVYDLDERVGQQIKTRMHEAFALMRQRFQEAENQVNRSAGNSKKQDSSSIPPFNRIYKVLLDNKPEFDRLLGATLATNVFYLLARAQFSTSLEELINQQVSQIIAQGVISDYATLGSERHRRIIVRRLPSWSETIEKTPDKFLDLDDAKKKVTFYCREMAADLPAGQRWAICELAQSLVIPNLVLNRAETEERKNASLEELKPVYFRIKKGEMLVREGERITPIHIAKLQALQKDRPQDWWLLNFLATAMILGLLVGITYQLARLFIRKFPRNFAELVFLASLLIFVALLNPGLVDVTGVLARVSPLISKNLIYLLPVALAPMLTGIFIGLETAVVIAFIAPIMTGLVLEKPFYIFIYFVAGGLVGVWGIQHCRNRWALIRAGLLIGLVNLVSVTALKLLEFPLRAPDFFIGMVFAAGGGLLISVLVTGMAPVIEVLFNFTSDFRLLELRNLDQPILRELMVMAPGTYHHSIVVGNMVEAAAEAIGANPLLAKTAAYYHDVGKIKKPAYFVENQLGGENKHEKLAPSMSSLILLAHVKDGVELGRQNRVGSQIIDIIRQHHGTSFISYFYNKAKQQAANPQQINIEDYRYPGPRPQTKEAGLVLLADQVEAASKTLLDPTPARIQGLVQKIINNIFADGQLDECELTLKDLHQIAKSFIKILSGIFHQRIEYPGSPDKSGGDKKKGNEDLDKQPTKKDSHKSSEDQEKSREDLKRLGIF